MGCSVSQLEHRTESAAPARMPSEGGAGGAAESETALAMDGAAVGAMPLDGRGFTALLTTVDPAQLASLSIAQNPLRYELVADRRPTVGDRVVLLESMELRVLVEDDHSEDTPYLDDAGDWLAEKDVRPAQPASLDEWRAARDHLAALVKLERLDLSGCGVDADSADVLAASLSNGGAPSLTWVNLRSNPLGSGGASLAALFGVRQQLRTLLGLGESMTTLDLKEMRMDWGAGLVLASELSARRSAGTATSLLLNGNTSLLVDFAAIPAAQQAWSTLCAAIASSDLNTLALDNIGPDGAAAAELSQQLLSTATTTSALCELSVAENTSLGREGAAALARMVLASPKLRHLRFGPQAGLRVPVHRTELMVVLDVSGRGLGPEDCHLLAAAVASNAGLLSLKLSGNPVTGGEMGWDERSQEYSVCVPGTNDVGIRELAEVVKQSQIKTVELDNCGLTGSSCVCLADCMQSSPHLQSLSLFQNDFTTDGLAELIAAAEANPSVRSITGLPSESERLADFSRRRLALVGCRIIAAELNLKRYSQNLTELSLACNFIGAPEVSASAGTVSVAATRGTFARLGKAWGEVTSDPDEGEVTLKWLADGTESYWISVSDLSPVVSSRDQLTEDYSHVYELGEAIRSSSLTAVDLSNCLLDGGSATALSRGLGWGEGHSSVLQSLILLGNSIPSETLAELQTAAAACSVNIEFEGTGILPSDRAANALEELEAQSTPLAKQTESSHTELDPTVAEYIRDGITARGLRHAIKMLVSHGGIIDDNTTTSDLCQIHLKPTTLPDGWLDEAELILVDAEGNDVSANRWYKHTYVEKATGERHSKPPEGTRSFCQLLAADPSTAHLVGRPTIFLSHAWVYKILNLITAVEAFVDALPEGTPEPIFWFDCFSLDQHAQSAQGSEWWASTFMQAIGSMGHTVMMLSPWSSPLPLTRSWCLWELYCTVKTGSTFAVCLGPAEQAAFEAALMQNLNVLLDSFASIDVRQAKAGILQDQENILAAIEQSESGAAGLNKLAIEHLRRWVIGQARAKVRVELGNGRLSTEALDAAHSVTVVLQQVGESTDALHLAEHVVRGKEAYHGEHHASTLSSKLLLGTLLRDQGNYAEARRLYDIVVKGRTQLLGEAHVLTLQAKGSLANLLDDQGETGNASAMYEAVLAQSTEQLGHTHSFTLMTRQNHATVLHSLGKTEAAQRAYEEVIRGYEEVHGPRHSHTLTAVLNFANLLDDTGCTARAKELYARVIEGNHTQFGSNHTSTLTAQMALANLLRQNGEVQAARELCDTVVERFTAVCGASHTLTLSALTLRGSILEDLGLCHECLVVREDVLQRYQQLLGNEHAFVRDSEMNLGAVLMWLPGRLQEAKERTQRVITRCTEELGSDHISTLHAQNNLALIFHLTDDHASARELYRQIVASYVERVGASHRFSLNAQLGLAISMDAAEESDGTNTAEEVEALLKGVVTSFEAHRLDPAAKETTTTTTTTTMAMPLVEAAVYLAEHQVERGCVDDRLLEDLNKLVDAAVVNVGTLHRISAYASSARGLLLYRRGLAQEAEAEMRDALARQQRIHGEDFFYTRKTQRRLDELLAARGMTKEDRMDVPVVLE
jgi:tetratricopeptide (TPR) repeat protein